MKNDMTTPQALKILKEYNDWRRGKETEMLNPKTIGKAIDKAIEVLTKQQDNNNKNIKELDELIKMEKCKECGGTGIIKDGEYSEDCVRCGGIGQIEIRK